MRWLTMRAWVSVRALAVCAAVSGCAEEIGGPPERRDGGTRQDDGGLDGGGFGNPDPNALGSIPDAAFSSLDATPTVDAFFVNDPPPMYCGPDAGGDRPDSPGGTPECPNDKNRQGCPCPEEGMEASCWPGMRVHRGRGVCRDGTAVCLRTDEFGLRWGACEGYRLPDDNAGAGAEACGCFSSGTWSLDNLAPCIHVADNGDAYLYSSVLNEEGHLDCGARVGGVPPVPAANWSNNTLKIDCAGQFELCFAIKAGDVGDPRDSDCVLMRHCVDVWYPEAGEVHVLPAIAGWVSSDTQCAQRFIDSGGYGEMSVLGQSIDCDVVDDGTGDPYVFHRTDYCPPSCQDTPDTPECRDCSVGGSGMFD